MVSDDIAKMDYWNLTSKSRGQRSLSLGTQYRVFSKGIKKHDEGKGSEIKRSEDESQIGDKKEIGTKDSKPKDEENKEKDNKGGASSSTETGVPTESTDDRPPSGDEKGSNPLKRKRDPTTEEEEQQEDSKDVADEQSSGEKVE